MTRKTTPMLTVGFPRRLIGRDLAPPPQLFDQPLEGFVEGIFAAEVEVELGAQYDAQPAVGPVLLLHHDGDVVLPQLERVLRLWQTTIKPGLQLRKN